MSAILSLYRFIQLLLLLYSTILKSEAASELRVIGENGMHACLGKNLNLECTVHGGKGDSTVWQGTAFSDCEITLLHIRFRQGTAGVCNSGAISGWSVRVENNESSYISQLRVAITAEMVGKNIECNRDNGTIIYTIGRYLIKTVSSWPVIIDPQLIDTVTSSQLSFSWEPAISDCPTADIHYYILSSNCGSCPSVTADTSITCVDMPSCGLCILAVQTAVGDYTVKKLLSAPVYVSLNQARKCAFNNSEMITGSKAKGIKNIKISFTTFMASVASTAVLAITLTLCVTVTIVALRFTVKKKARNFRSLQRADTERYHQVADTVAQKAEARVYEEINTHHTKSADCLVTLENEVYFANGKVTH